MAKAIACFARYNQTRSDSGEILIFIRVANALRCKTNIIVDPRETNQNMGANSSRC
jgi:hypothetical protein